MDQTCDIEAGLADAFKGAMRRLAATVTIITARAHGRPYGMAATAVTSVSTEPPALLICVNTRASIHDAIRASGHFGVNILGVEHGDLVAPFSGGRKGEARFAHGDWDLATGPVPVLRDAQASLACALRQHIAYGTHTIFVGAVEEVRLNGVVAPLLYRDGALAVAAAMNPS